MINLREVSLSDLAIDIDRITNWLNMLEGNSFGENSAQQVLEFVQDNNWALTYYCQDDEPIGLVAYVVVTYPAHRTLVVVGAAGASASAWLEASEVLIELAKSKGCTKVEAKGRKGWSRVFKAQGWRELYRTIGISV
jgi:hypothetical protein